MKMVNLLFITRISVLSVADIISLAYSQPLNGIWIFNYK